MRRSSLPLIFATSALVKLSSAAPFSGLGTRQNPALVDCNSPIAGFSELCWDMLDISNYLGNTNPTPSNPKGWVWDHPQCDMNTVPGYNGIGCCYPGEPWSSCFLRYGWGQPGSNCTTIDPQHCAWSQPAHFSPSLDPWEAARVRYVMWNIYQINDLFTTYFTALQYAYTQAALIISPLTHLIDKIVEPTIDVMDILSALTVALCFIGLPDVIVGVEAAFTKAAIDQVKKNVAQGFLFASMQTPGFAKAMWPSGTEESQLIQIDQLDQYIGDISMRTNQIINNGLGLLMSDAASFIAFAGYGRYSGSDSMSIPNQTATLAISLKTLLTSKSLGQNGWYAGVRPFDLTMRPFESGRACPGPPGPVTPVKTCGGGPTWISPHTHQMYFLMQEKNKERSDSRHILDQIEDNNWADLPTLFDGAYNCTASGKAGGSVVNVQTDGTLDMSCMSQLPIYADGCPSDVAMMPDGSCPFGHWGDSAYA